MEHAGMEPSDMENAWYGACVYGICWYDPKSHGSYKTPSIGYNVEENLRAPGPSFIYTLQLMLALPYF